MKYLFLLLVIIGLGCYGNKTSELNGLWSVQNVSVGGKTMTPIGRWTRFNSDFSFESGNGWYQHTIGNWKINQEKTELQINNENFIKDSYGPFRVKILANEMTWTRTEDGEEVVVSLKKINKIPKSNRDEILGLWLLESNSGDESRYTKTPEGENSEKYLFLKWDRKFVLGLNEGRITGVYSIHGHKPEIELIPYDEKLKREFWTFDIENNLLTMKLLNAEIETKKTYRRIDEFPKQL